MTPKKADELPASMEEVFLLKTDLLYSFFRI